MLPPTTNWINSSAIHVKDGVVPNVNALVTKPPRLRVSASKMKFTSPDLEQSETEQRRSFPRQSPFRARNVYVRARFRIVGSHLVRLPSINVEFPRRDSCTTA